MASVDSMSSTLPYASLPAEGAPTFYWWITSRFVDHVGNLWIPNPLWTHFGLIETPLVGRGGCRWAESSLRAQDPPIRLRMICKVMPSMAQWSSWHPATAGQLSLLVAHKAGHLKCVLQSFYCWWDGDVVISEFETLPGIRRPKKPPCLILYVLT